MNINISTHLDLSFYHLSIFLSSIYLSIIYLCFYHLYIFLSSIYLSIIYLSLYDLSIYCKNLWVCVPDMYPLWTWIQYIINHSFQHKKIYYLYHKRDQHTKMSSSYHNHIFGPRKLKENIYTYFKLIYVFIQTWIRENLCIEINQLIYIIHICIMYIYYNIYLKSKEIEKIFFSMLSDLNIHIWIK